MKLLCAISHHGLGHLAQSAPVLNTLAHARPDLEWLVWSGLPRQSLEARLEFGFEHRHEAADLGLLMHDALRVDEAASHRAYLEFHGDWAGRVRREAEWMRLEGIQGVLSNAAYLPLAAANRAGIASVGFCSLNWLDIAHHYLGAAPDMAPVFADMREAYLGASAFLRVSPGMPMSWLANLEAVPPVATMGQRRRTTLDERLGIARERKLLMLGLGGVPYRHPDPLPALHGITWVVPDAWPTHGRADLVAFRRTGLPFPDLLASCDALVTKVGYGSFVEAAGLGLPVLYLDRPDWPETPWLAPWLAEHTRARAIDERQLFSGVLGDVLETLWRSPTPRAPLLSGASVICRRARDLLGA